MYLRSLPHHLYFDTDQYEGRSHFHVRACTSKRRGVATMVCSTRGNTASTSIAVLTVSRNARRRAVRCVRQAARHCARVSAARYPSRSITFAVFLLVSSAYTTHGEAQVFTVSGTLLCKLGARRPSAGVYSCCCASRRHI